MAASTIYHNNGHYSLSSSQRRVTVRRHVSKGMQIDAALIVGRRLSLRNRPNQGRLSYKNAMWHIDVDRKHVPNTSLPKGCRNRISLTAQTETLSHGAEVRLNMSCSSVTGRWHAIDLDLVWDPRRAKTR